MMKKQVYGLAAAAMLAVFAQSALAQNTATGSGGTPTASGSLAPAGQGPGAMASGNDGKSNRTRANRKAEVKMEREMGGLTPAGQGGVKPDHMNKVTPRVKSRADVKAETRAAERSGTLQPAGETPQPVGQPPRK